MFERFPNIRGELKDDFLLGDDFDRFHDADFKQLKKKVGILEQEKAKAEAERDELKRQLEEMTKTNEEIKTVMIKKAKKLKKMKDVVEDNTKLFEVLQADNTDLCLQNEKLNDINKTLNHMISELHEASGNEFSAMKLEMEAMKAHKAMKDEQLTMLYTVLRVKQMLKWLMLKLFKHKDSYLLLNNKGERKKEPEKLLLKWKEEEEVVEEEEEEVKLDDDLFDIDNYPEGSEDDDQDQGSPGLLIVNPNVQQKIEYFMNDVINEQEEEVPRSRAEMLEELGLDDGKFKFDIEDEIPPSQEREYEFKYAEEANQYNEVIVEEASDSSDEETNFHYSCVDETFPSLAEMFEDQNEDEIRRKIVEKITTEGVPRTIPRENLVGERKKWCKVMPKERKFIRPLQYFTHDANISWGDILSWGYLEDLQVYAIRREQGLKQFYYGLEVKQHDQHLWDYVKKQAKARYPDWKPQYPKQIVTILENGEKDITLDVKPPRCLKNIPPRAMEQDFHEDFEGWLYNETTAEAVISLLDKSTGKS
ncbi:hypothetical protein Hanom_Chr01g00032781 [Helianthus anomalus]